MRITPLARSRPDQSHPKQGPKAQTQIAATQHRIAKLTEIQRIYREDMRILHDEKGQPLADFAI